MSRKSTKEARVFRADRLKNIISQYELGIDIDYHSECQGECDDDDYCRDNTITIESISGTVNLVKLAGILIDGSTDEIWRYFVERALVHSQAKNLENWSVETSQGYYGEELDGLRLLPDVASEIVTHIIKMTKASHNELVEAALVVEYGYILDSAKGLDWSIQIVNRMDIIVPQQDYYRRMDKKVLEFYKPQKYDEDKYTGPLAVVIEWPGGFKLIDGYHRVAANQNENLIKALVGESR